MSPRLENFLVCDMVRQEASGKLLVVGLFPAMNVVANLAPGGAAILTTGLTFLFGLDGLAGVTDGEFQIEIQRDGETVERSRRYSFHKEPNERRHVVTHQVAPFRIDAAGRFDVRFVLDVGGGPRSFTKHFNIQSSAPLH